MSGIYIPDMEMPTDDWAIVVRKNGDVFLYNYLPCPMGLPWAIRRGSAKEIKEGDKINGSPSM